MEKTKATENLINIFLIVTKKYIFSSIIDCFDKMIFVWKIDKNLNTEIFSSMLDRYFETLMNGEKNIIHSSWGAHNGSIELIGIDF